jgi:hypothetical protein
MGNNGNFEKYDPRKGNFQFQEGCLKRKFPFRAIFELIFDVGSKFSKLLTIFLKKCNF